LNTQRTPFRSFLGYQVRLLSALIQQVVAALAQLRSALTVV